MKFELHAMRELGSGAIVNCSSLGGLIGGNQRGTYHAAKHGVIGFTKSAALECATRGIRVNDICPDDPGTDERPHGSGTRGTH